MADILNIEDGVLNKCTDKSVTSVTIPEGVTRIGWYAFGGCTSLSSVVIPESVTEIGWDAFKGCESLASIKIGASVTRIGGYAFEGCKSLSSVEIPSSVTEIGGDAFKGCNINELSHPCLTIKGGLVVEESKLLYCASQSSSITIPEGVTEIGGGAFAGCSSLSSVVIPSSVTKIGGNAFAGCESLTSVVIPESVTEISWDAFKGCNINELSHPCLTIKGGLVVEESKLLYCASQSSSITIPEGVTEIGDSAFMDCTSLASVVIPPSVTEIGWDAFRGCSSLTSVVIPESVTEIGRVAFYGCSSLSSVSIPSSVAEIGGGAFENCKSIAKVTLGDDFKKVPSEWFDDLNEINPNYEIVCTEGSSTYKAIKRSSKLKLHLKSLNVTKEDLELQKAKNAKIAEVQKAGVDAILPMVLEGVADSSFSLLSNTKSATVALVQVGRNTGVFKLGADSSKWLPKLQKVIEAMADSTKSGEDIFGVIKEQKMPLCEIPAKKAMFTTLKADSSGSLNLFASGALRKMKYDGMKDIGLFGITEIGEWAFLGCESLTSVKFGGTMAQWEAVKEKLHLLEDIPATVVKCADGEWQKPDLWVVNGFALKCLDRGAVSVTIPEGVMTISNKAFEGCTSLASVVIPPSVTKIGYDAFYGCASLASVVIPESVTEIGGHAFDGCESLSSVEIPSSVTEIGGHAFDGCESLSSVEIPAGVTAIYEYAFYGCKALASVVIPESVTEIGWYAFSGCTSLSSVEFSGTVAQWKSVEKARVWHGGVPAKSVKCSDGEAEL